MELPYRLIQLYTFEDDVVLDPFVGSGTACIAALKTKRNYVAYDIDKNYCDLAEQRIKQFLQEQVTLFSEKNPPLNRAKLGVPLKAERKTCGSTGSPS
ncbi:hypothetical protein COV27_02420 [candidate division WWE3 bacterium CG10_big_fil_rev_8_21_14_0_10_39_14]|nr:MAG: hypothetical protein COV27_02420 [candidate division WWE3 bacterium CG10_big_fil_rev_8_21_14_0_10_39_14]